MCAEEKTAARAAAFSFVLYESVELCFGREFCRENYVI